MSRQRYFNNKFSDYIQDVSFEVSKEEWLSHIMSLVEKIVDATQSRSRISHDGGLYVGTAGIAYMLYYISKYEPLAQHKSHLLKLAKDIILKDIKYSDQKSPDSEKVSFLLGPAGVYATAAMIGEAIENKAMVEENVEKYKWISSHCLRPNFLRCGADELFVGRAGYLCGALALEKNLKAKIFTDKVVNSICKTIVESGYQYSQRTKSSAPLMYAYYNTEYLGAAHGLSSILQIILCCQTFCESNLPDVNLVKSAVDWLLATQQANGNFVPACDELNKQRPEEEELVHWCHGAPGIVYLFARAYAMWKEPAYLEACIKCGDLTWQIGLLRKGPGICHGVAGSGYVFLLLYRMTQDRKYLYRAHKFAEFILADEFRQGARTPDSPFSLYEGWAGTVCFLIDLLQPDKAEFPFFSVI